MPDNNQTNTPIQTPTDAPAPSIPAIPSTPSKGTGDLSQSQPLFPPTPSDLNSVQSSDTALSQPSDPSPEQTAIANSNAIMQEVASKIADAHNILVALSSDPSVDDLAGAIGLSLYLDNLGKRATAIYSGTTPNALEFLKPEDNFDTSTDTLQDFVIALNKDKADHLRYKLDGDYVKIFITPYRTRIAEDDLDFSYGDYNVDLILALDVANSTDLDSALREHGRIMHDATIINITNGDPGKFGELEWSNKYASSVCEMLAELLTTISGKNPIGEEAATALLTGIVAATDRFSEANTTPDTMKVASKLMESGANQQLISQNIANVENQTFNISASDADSESSDPTALDIEHDEEENRELEDSQESNKPEESNELEEPSKSNEFSKPEEPKELGTSGNSEDKTLSSLEPEDKKEEPEIIDKKEDELASLPEESSENKSDTSAPTGDSPDLLSDLKAAEASLTNAGAEITPESVQEPLRIEDTSADTLPAPAATPSTALPEVKPEKVIVPSEDFIADPTSSGSNKYGQMLEEALAEANAEATPVIQNPAMAAPNIPDANGTPIQEAIANPAASIAPPVASVPEINGVPEINYMPPADSQILPPPPAPPVDLNSPMPAIPGETPSIQDTAQPAPAPLNPATTMPAVADPAPTPADTSSPVAPPPSTASPVADPSAFKIPGIQ